MKAKDCVSAHLTSADIAIVERLAGRILEPGLKSFLLRFYGLGGECDTVQKFQAAAALNCEEHCSECGFCQPFCADPMLEQLYVIIMLYDRGLFDVATDNYETVKRKVHIQVDSPPDGRLF